MLCLGSAVGGCGGGVSSFAAPHRAPVQQANTGNRLFGVGGGGAVLAGAVAVTYAQKKVAAFVCVRHGVRSGVPRWLRHSRSRPPPTPPSRTAQMRVGTGANSKRAPDAIRHICSTNYDGIQSSPSFIHNMNTSHRSTTDTEYEGGKSRSPPHTWRRWRHMPRYGGERPGV